MLDDNNNLITASSTANSNDHYDLLVVKTDKYGNTVWSQTFNVGTQGDAIAGGITLDGSGNVYVCGTVYNGNNNYDAVVIKYNSAGTQQWYELHNGSQSLYDALRSIVWDSGTGNIYASGSTFESVLGDTDFLTMAYNSSGTLLWNKTYDNSGVGLNDLAGTNYIKSGTLTVNGPVQISNNGWEYASVTYQLSNGTLVGSSVTKYNASGVEQWVDVHDGGGEDEGQAILTDAAGNIFASGYSDKLGNSDFLTQVFDTGGALLWSGRYNGMFNKDDKATKLLLDTDGDLLVTGRSVDLQAEFWKTVKYNRHEWQNPHENTGFGAHPYMSNNGQLLHTDQSIASEIVYYSDQQYPAVYFANDKVSMVIASLDTIATTQDTMRRVDMHFINKSPGSVKRVAASAMRDDYINYYLGHIPEGRERVSLYNEVLYTDAFPDIDVLFGQEGSGQSIYFICKPGANPLDIQMLFSGESSLNINQLGELIIGTSLKDIVLPEPLAYQLDAQNNVVALNWSPDFSLVSGKVGFSTGSYDSGKTLVFEISGSTDCEPGTVDMDNNDWTTYYSGGTAQFASDEIKGIETDQENNVVYAGYTFHSDLPLQNEEYLYSGQNDGFIVKFNNDAERMWATYFGSSNFDFVNGLAVDNNNNIFIAGQTDGMIPLLDNGVAYHDGVEECGPPTPLCITGFVANFDPDGMNEFATFYGEGYNQFTSIRDIGINNQGEIFIIGNGDVIHQDNENNIMNDIVGEGFIAKFSSDFKLIWSTQIADTEGFYVPEALGFDSEDNIFFTGRTKDESIMPYGPSGAYLAPAFGSPGESDILVGKITAHPHDLVWLTNYGGDDSDFAYDIEVDKNNDVYICGRTESTNLNCFDPQLSNIIYNTTYTTGGYFGYDMILAKFGNDGEPLWASYFGGSKDDEAYDISIDSDNNVFFIGYTINADIPIMPPPQSNLGTNYYLQTSPIRTDAIIIMMSESFAPLWITPFGGEGADWGQKIHVSNDKLYIGGLAGKFQGTGDESGFPLEDLGEATMNSDVYYQCDYGDLGIIYGNFIARFDLNYITEVSEKNDRPKNEITIFPNPTNGVFTICSKAQLNEELEINIVDYLGRLVKKEAFTAQSSDNCYEVDIQNLPAGTYFVNLSTSEQHLSAKIILF